MWIDKTWMFIKDRWLPEWQNGMKAFLDMAFAKVAVANTIRCPCRKCVNVVPKTRDEVALDLCKFGMDQAYKRWIFHGEELYDESFDDNNEDIDIRSDQERCDDVSAYEMMNNMIRGENLASTTIGGDDDFQMRDREEPNDNASKFYRLLRDAEQKLWKSMENNAENECDEDVIGKDKNKKKELGVEELDRLDHQIAEILCKLEQVFPPSFFDIMMHLPIHLAYEAKVAGPVQYSWMYPIERYLRTLKGYVRNKDRPERLIAEGYISEECMTFCSWYLHDMDTKFNRPERNVDANQNEATSGLSVFASVNRNRQNYTFETLSKSELQMAHHYILTNCEEIAPWVDVDSTPAPKRGRGVLKGLKLKHHLPLIGVKNWKEIPQEAKNTMKAKVLERWRLADDDFAQAKIFKIAQERYRGWRADLSATHKAYAGDMEALIRNKPEELDIEEWKAMIAYFETDDFKRDRETQKEPDALELWAMTYCPKGQWVNNDDQHVYDEAKQKIAEVEEKEGRTLSSNERDAIFQSIVISKSKSKSRYVRGQGYMSRPPTSAERVRDEVNNEIQSLRRLLETERAERAEERVEREAQIESLRAENQTQLESLRQSMREEFMGLLANQSQ
uniref:Transposase-associated domain-containing protein n=1 Tax=Fagus sylvatica TaxID=28930 RepID=A0A2N9EKC6_FAGSY